MNIPPDRPAIPLLVPRQSASVTLKLVADFKAWHDGDWVRDIAKKEVIKARDFLIKNRSTTDENGDEISDENGWLPGFIGARAVADSEKESNRRYAQIDARRARIRYRAFAFGMHQFLGLLNKKRALPEGAVKYFDDATNLIPLVIHERLVGWRLDDDEVSSLSLEDLRPWFLRQRGPLLDLRNREMVFMSGLGMWKAERDKREWKIRCGEIAYLFHVEALVPALQHFDTLLASPPSDKHSYALAVEATMKRLRRS